MDKKNRVPEPYYLGGIASVCSTCITHPLDTVKIHLQTQGVVKYGFIEMSKYTIRTNGFLALYNGLSAAALMSATYSTSRFAFYGFAKEYLLSVKSTKSANKNVDDLTLMEKIFISSLSGVVGSLFGTPADVCNIRMQNDSQLPVESRRNYGNCFTALNQIYRKEGFCALYTGLRIAVLRAVLSTIGQLAFYDELKSKLIRNYQFKDTIFTHFTASMGAGFIATLITMPTDVIKTLLMNGKPGEYSGILDVAKKVLKNDKLGLFKGFFPRYIRLAPFTCCTFIIYEKLKLVF